MASTYLSRTQTAGNRKTFTWSAWIKRSDVASRQTLLSAGIDGNDESFLRFDAANYISIKESTGNSPEFNLDTSSVYRDPNAWYHIVFSVDTTQATASDRIKLYVNGSQVTSWTNESYPSQNYDFRWNNNSQATYLGLNVPAHQDIYDGYMSEVHFTDGTAYAASTFGQTDTSGVWIPIVGPSVTYGTNGYYLKFENSGAMGTDSSGNSNTFSVANGTLRQVDDSPTNVFCTLSSINNSGSLLYGNLYYSYGSSWSNGVLGTQSFSAGKWYWEARLGGNYWFIGIQDVDSDQTNNNANGAYKWTYAQNAKKYNNTTYEDYGATYAVNDIISVAYDADNGSLTFYKNGASQGVAYSSLNTSKRYAPFVNAYNSNLTLNFGQNGTFNGTVTAQGNADGNGNGDFYYAPPSGYLALCTDNLSSELTIPIDDGSSAFHTQLYTGTGSARTITNDAVSNFQPDWVWAKQRNDTTAHSHNLVDAIRGGTKTIYSNTEDSQQTISQGITGFTTDGFTLGTNAAINNNTINYVAWQWKAGGTAPSNTYAVKVVSDSGNKYRFDDFGTSAITLELQEGGTFTFDQSDNSNSGHPLRFSTTANGTHGGGTEYTTGVTTNGTPGQAGAYTRITVAAGAPTLYYYCTQHSGMGGQANTGSLFGFTNVKGTLQGVVSPNTNAGFSVVTFTANGGSQTIGHGLSQAPVLSIRRRLDVTSSWFVHTNLIDGGMDYLQLNTTAASSSSSLANFTATTSGADDNSNQYVVYFFHSVEGFSKIGTYKGNGSTNGTFVYTGFRPAYVLIKALDRTVEWTVMDSARDTYNPAGKQLSPDSSAREYADAEHHAERDFLSNGFKLRGNANATNASSSNNYIYIAFAENPFVTSTGKPVTAR